MKPGDRVRVIADGTIIVANDRALAEPCHKIDFDDRDIPGAAWFYAKRTHALSSVLAQEAWRDIAADMIREGRDAEAIALIKENSREAYGDATAYIKSLERVVNGVNAICVHRALWDRLQELPEVRRAGLQFTAEQADEIDAATATLVLRSKP